MILAVLRTRQFSCAIKNAFGGVDFINVVDALQQGSHALKTHTGVDIACRQVTDNWVTLFTWTIATNVLHEHEVPHFEVTIFISNRATIAAMFWAAVVINL